MTSISFPSSTSIFWLGIFGLWFLTGCDERGSSRSPSPPSRLEQPKPALKAWIKDPAPPVIGLVIGVGEYVEQDSLPNAVRDAELIRNTLKRINLEVIDCPDDPAVEQMQVAVKQFRKRLKDTPGAVGFVYFAGHGFASIDGLNWLAAKDCLMGISDKEMASKEWSRNLLPPEIPKPSSNGLGKPIQHAAVKGALPLTDLLACKQDAEGGLLICLDCCRTLVASQEQVRLKNCPDWVQISYSTSPGQQAYDGKMGETQFMPENWQTCCKSKAFPTQIC